MSIRFLADTSHTHRYLACPIHISNLESTCGSHAPCQIDLWFLPAHIQTNLFQPRAEIWCTRPLTNPISAFTRQYPEDILQTQNRYFFSTARCRTYLWIYPPISQRSFGNAESIFVSPACFSNRSLVFTRPYPNDLLEAPHRYMLTHQGRVARDASVPEQRVHVISFLRDPLLTGREFHSFDGIFEEMQRLLYQEGVVRVGRPRPRLLQPTARARKHNHGTFIKILQITSAEVNRFNT